MEKTAQVEGPAAEGGARYWWWRHSRSSTCCCCRCACRHRILHVLVLVLTYACSSRRSGSLVVCLHPCHLAQYGWRWDDQS